MPEDHLGELPEEPVPPDEFDRVVFDEEFVRGGSYEPPARTRAAIARFGNQQTSWRHGGGRDASVPAERRARSARPRPGSWVERLPLIVTIAVVAVVLILAYH